MPRWSEVEAEVPELAERAKAFFDAGLHKTIATLRRDGSPRISGTECLFVDGDLWLGSMWRAMKALDMQRDPRFVMHSSSADPSSWQGDSKVAGKAEEITDPRQIAAVLTKAPPGPAHLFRADITELVVISLAPEHTHLVIEAWHPGRGVTQHKR